MTAQPHTSFRISQEARDLLREIARDHGVSMTAVLELLIRDKARKVNKGRKVKR